MFYERDWFMRQIETAVQAIARVIFRKDKVEYEVADESNLSQTDLLYGEIVRLIAEKKLDEAESMLMEAVHTQDRQVLELAVDFYQKLNALSDAELEECGFSRERVSEGLKTVVTEFGLQDVIW